MTKFSRGQTIALAVAVVLIIAGILGLANVSRISNWMESSSVLSTTEPSTNMPTVGNDDDSIVSSDSTLDPSTSISSDGTIGTPDADGTPGSNKPSAGSSAPSKGSGSSGGTSVPGSPGTAPSSKPKAPTSPPSVEPLPEKTPAPPAKISVSVRVDASAAIAKGYSGGSTGASKATVDPGTSALDASKKSGLSIKTRSTGFGAYVAAIGSLSEKDYGGSSGWTYSVNGSTPSKSSASYTVKDGDSIVWIYVIN